MKRILIFTSLVCLSFVATHAYGQTVVELTQSQSMCMIGKGPGQDAAINPYAEEDKSVAIVKNLGPNMFEVRIQESGEIKRTIRLKSAERVELVLKKGEEVYFDSYQDTQGQIAFKPFANRE